MTLAVKVALNPNTTTTMYSRKFLGALECSTTGDKESKKLLD